MNNISPAAVSVLSWLLGAFFAGTLTGSIFAPVAVISLFLFWINAPLLVSAGYTTQPATNFIGWYLGIAVVFGLLGFSVMAWAFESPPLLHWLIRPGLKGWFSLFFAITIVILIFYIKYLVLATPLVAIAIGVVSFVLLFLLLWKVFAGIVEAGITSNTEENRQVMEYKGLGKLSPVIYWRVEDVWTLVVILGGGVMVIFLSQFFLYWNWLNSPAGHLETNVQFVAAVLTGGWVLACYWKLNAGRTHSNSPVQKAKNTA
jgi:hypothetical protein